MTPSFCPGTALHKTTSTSPSCVFPSRRSRIVASDVRSVDRPQPPPLAVVCRHIDPDGISITILDGNSCDSPSCEYSVLRELVPSPPPFRPHGLMRARSDRICSTALFPIKRTSRLTAKPPRYCPKPPVLGTKHSTQFAKGTWPQSAHNWCSVH